MTTHHDGLSGTEKQAVADDYAQRLAEGEAETRVMMAQVRLGRCCAAEVGDAPNTPARSCPLGLGEGGWL